MKKLISILAIVVLAVSTMSVTALAHGGRGNGCGTQRQQHDVCTVDDCGITGLHRHSNAWYRGQTCSRGTYRLCAEDDCDIAGPHQHDDVWYCSQNCRLSDYDVCAVTGCTQIGLHKHDGVYYYCASRETGRGCGRGR